MTNYYEKPDNKKATDQEKKYEFIFHLYKLELKDREIIQSKLKFFISLSISSLLSIFFAVKNFADLSFLGRYHLTEFFVLNLIILNFFCFYLIYKIFSFKNYKEITELRKKDLKKNLNIFYKENNYELIDLFNANKIINVNRRADIRILFVLYYIIGFFHFAWFALYALWQIFK